MPRRRRTEKRLRTPRLEWSVEALVAFANGRGDWETFWGGPEPARQAWAALQRGDQTADYEQMWTEHEASRSKPDPRLETRKDEVN